MFSKDFATLETMLISTITAGHNQDTSKLSVNPFHALACLQAVETSENENFLKFFQDGRGGGGRGDIK